MSDPNQPPSNLHADPQTAPPASVRPAAAPVVVSPTPPAAPATARPVASIEKSRLQLFDLYKKFRYNDIAFSELSRQAYRLEAKVRWSVVITLAISLLTDIIPGMNAEALRWIWGALGALATVLTIYAMSVQSGEKQFKWFELAKRARAWASKVESFTTQVENGRIEEAELGEAIDSYNEELNAEFGDGGPGYNDFEVQNRLRMTDELRATLKAEGKAS